MMPGQALAVTREGDKLLAQMTGQGKRELMTESETKFFLPDSPAEFAFVRDDKGTSEKLILRQGEFAYTFNKVK